MFNRKPTYTFQGSHVHFSGGDRVGLLRANSVFVCMLWALSQDHNVGGRGLHIHIHLISHASGLWQSLVPIAPWNALPGDFALWRSYEFMHFNDMGNVWHDLGPNCTNFTNTNNATHVENSRLLHFRQGHLPCYTYRMTRADMLYHIGLNVCP